MRLSSRIDRVPPSTTVAVARRAAAMRENGRLIFDFGAGEPDLDSPPRAVRAAQQALADGQTKYTTLAGIPQLRAAIAEHYGERGGVWGADEVLVTTGAKAALYQVIHSVFDEPDEVLIPSPCWVSIPAQVALAGATPVKVPTRSPGFSVDVDALLEHWSERTRGVIVNTPCNPTGCVVPAETLGRLAQICADRDALLLTDETYEHFVYEPARQATVAEWSRRYPDHVALVSSFSKGFAMTGWRVGYLLGPRWLVDAAASLQSHMTSNATTFAMFGAQEALASCAESPEEMKARFRRRRDWVVAALDGLDGVTCEPPGGAFYAFPDVSAGFDAEIQGSQDYARWLLDTAGVVVVPGAAFGDDRHVRVSFAASMEQLEGGIDAWRRALSQRREGS